MNIRNILVSAFLLVCLVGCDGKIRPVRSVLAGDNSTATPAHLRDQGKDEVTEQLTADKYGGKYYVYYIRSEGYRSGGKEVIKDRYFVRFIVVGPSVYRAPAGIDWELPVGDCTVNSGVVCQLPAYWQLWDKDQATGLDAGDYEQLRRTAALPFRGYRSLTVESDTSLRCAWLIDSSIMSAK